MSPSAVEPNRHGFCHASVLLDGAVETLVHDPAGVYLDGTFGRGGHSRAILARLAEKGRLLAIDRDPQAIAEARKLEDPRFTIEQAEFANLGEVTRSEERRVGKECRSRGLPGRSRKKRAKRTG